VVVFSAKELQNLPPRDFLRAFVDEVGIKIRPGTPIPEPKDTENMPRWLRLDLPDWLCMYLDEDRRQNLRPYPIWIVVNAMVSADERVLWAENLKDFVATLTGAHDPGQAAVDLPQLRWLFLGQKLGAFPISGVPCRVEDLASDVSYDSDFAECVQLAWRSVLDKGEGELDQQLLLGIASTLRAASGAVPIRKFLAIGVRNMITRTSGGGGGV